MPLADVGGQDQNPLRTVLVTKQAQLAVAFPSHHGN